MQKIIFHSFLLIITDLEGKSGHMLYIYAILFLEVALIRIAH